MPINIPTTEAITEFNRSLPESTGQVISPGNLQDVQESPNRTFGGHEFISNWPEKVLLVIRDIAQGHAFLDGNKRTASWAVGRLYELNNVEVPPKDEIEDWVNRMTEPDIDRVGERAILAEMNARAIPEGQKEWDQDAEDDELDEEFSEGSEHEEKSGGSEEKGENGGSEGEGEGEGESGGPEEEGESGSGLGEGGE